MNEGRKEGRKARRKNARPEGQKDGRKEHTVSTFHEMYRLPRHTSMNRGPKPTTSVSEKGTNACFDNCGWLSDAVMSLTGHVVLLGMLQYEIFSQQEYSSTKYSVNC